MDREVNVDSIRVLEEQTKEHERSIIKLKRARNSLLNVSRLPPEVLGEIFCWNIVFEEPFGGLEEESYNFLLVCRHWYEVALRTPELWSFWGNNLADWEARCLRSSVNIPLDLVLDGLSYMFGSLGDSQRMALEDRAARDTIRRVHLQSDMHELLTSIISPLLSLYGGLRTNSLESLILGCEPPGMPLDVSFLARSCLPKLRHLELSGCMIPSWDHLTSQTTLLTTLDLYPDETSPVPTMSQLLLMLAHNPHLQKLELNRRAVPDDDDDGKSCRVLLRHLKELKLEGGIGPVFGLLRRLDRPRKMDKLSLTLSDCEADDIPQTVGPYLQDHLALRGRPRNGLGVFLSSDRCIVLLVGDADGFYPSTLRTASFTSIYLQLDEALPKDAPDKLTLDLIAHMPREEIVHFQTCGSLEVVKDLRVQMPALKTLDLLMVPLYTVFPTQNQDASHVHERFPPSLKHLFLERLQLGAYGWLPLLVFLSNRAASGNRLDSVRIDGLCHMCSKLGRGIRSMVREFEITGECAESCCPFDACMM